MPDDDPREKLDLRNDSEWELFQSVLQEEAVANLSDSDHVSSAHHSSTPRQAVGKETPHGGPSGVGFDGVCSRSGGAAAPSGALASMVRTSVVVPTVRDAAPPLAELRSPLLSQERQFEKLVQSRTPPAQSRLQRGEADVASSASDACGQALGSGSSSSSSYEDMAYYELDLEEEDEVVSDALYARYLLPHLAPPGDDATNGGGGKAKAPASELLQSAVSLHGVESGGSKFAFRRVFARLLSRLERELMFREAVLSGYPQSAYAAAANQSGTSSLVTGKSAAGGSWHKESGSVSVAEVSAAQKHLTMLRDHCQDQLRHLQQFHDLAAAGADPAQCVDSLLQSIFPRQLLSLGTVQSDFRPPLTLTASRSALALAAPLTVPLLQRESSATTHNSFAAMSRPGLSLPQHQSDEEDDTISERYRALRVMSLSQLLALLGEDYGLSLLRELRPRLFPRCPPLPEMQETALCRAVLMHWARLRSLGRQSLLRAYHVFLMPLWAPPERTALPQPCDYHVPELQQAHHRLQVVQQDLDRARLIVDRVRRREKLKKELLRLSDEWWQAELLDQTLPDLVSSLRKQLVDAPADAGDSRIAIGIGARDAAAATEKRKRGRPRRADSLTSQDGPPWPPGGAQRLSTARASASPQDLDDGSDDSSEPRQATHRWRSWTVPAAAQRSWSVGPWTAETAADNEDGQCGEARDAPAAARDADGSGSSRATRGGPPRLGKAAGHVKRDKPSLPPRPVSTRGSRGEENREGVRTRNQSQQKRQRRVGPSR
eukprot:gene2113-1539_t